MECLENIVKLTDSYKICHFGMYPKNTQKVYSYFESRNGALYDYTEFFSLQVLLIKYLAGVVVTKEKIDEAEKLAARHFGNPDLFNRARWDYIVEKHGGKLPVEIKAVPEGTRVPVSNVLMTIVNTDDNCAWLSNHLETLLTHVWAGSTVATKSRATKELFKRYLNITCDVGENFPGLDFMLHDFGMRGVSSMESAGTEGAGHLINFLGTDTIIAMDYVDRYYGSLTGYSVPACYDDKTEILTELGFKKFEDLDKTLKVAQYNNGIVDFVQPLEYFKDRYKGEMIHFDSVGYKYVDICVTPNHKMVKLTKSTKKVEFFVASEKNYSSRNNIIIAGKASGTLEFTPLDRLKIAFQADGSWSSNKEKYNGINTDTIPIRFGFKKVRKINRLIEILSLLKFDYTTSVDKRGYTYFRISIPKEITLYKTFEWVNLSNLSSDYCEKFIDELAYWDSSIVNNVIIYSSTIEANTNIVASISALCNKKTQYNISVDKRNNRLDSYGIIISNRNSVGGSKSIKNNIAYDGFVYCVSVPSKMLIVRRNGRISICGNTEHSIMTAEGKAGEAKVIGNLIKNYPTGILSVVCDSYDIYNCVEKIIGEQFKDEILARDGKFVVRPDSGDPDEVVARLLNILYDKFGGSINKKGYKLLNPKIGLIWGDGIDYSGIESLLNTAMREGFSVEVLVFGQGGALLQKINRDTQRFAFKCSARMEDNEWIEIFKDPLDKSKASKRGRLKLVDIDGVLTTVGIDAPGEDIMKTVFLNGELVTKYTFEEVRANSLKY